ncbi:glycoside hydrolase family 2 protein [Arcticibacter eurypsychrophilus]|uniref:glycoside hydrolase family 2 protein n=1 Tax=Arcticibacter eurypsychrophilus TaxID=1434752 RepID=UPI00084CF199|nr:glycoside hydrolase family 2 [Arcticibacter eurypsychrophilus]
MNLLKIILIGIVSVPLALHAQEWQPKKAALMSKFSKDVNPEQVLAEYPRPQLVRSNWLNLNGLWQFQPASGKSEALPKGNLSRTILVPFPVESALSGVMEHHESIWYRRKFKVPATWKGEQVLLHFGAVDYEAEVFINGKSFGIHTGGYDPFSYDITKALKGAGDQDIAVRVFDPTDNGGFPRGKQTLKPQGIMYTSVTGIWQTVWLEPVPKTNISNIKIVPDIDKSVVKLFVSSSANAQNLNVNIQVKDNGKVVQTITGKANAEISVPVVNAKLWSPDSPFLYDLVISLSQGAKKVDAIESYFGMRKISIGTEDGFKKMFLNNKFLFQIGPLDQGFWPDGGYTAPTDAALKYDLQMIKNFGFNMVRKHIKVEPYRWYYWADKLGLLVWQDMPSPNSYTEKVPPVDTAAFASELERLVETHWNSPSIVSWVIFNEGQAQHNTPGLVKKVYALDSTRLINQASGGGHFDVGDVLDIHSYPPPAVPFSKVQALACGEYGGIGFIKPGHIWKSGPTYIMIDNEQDYTNLYDQFATDLAIYKTNNGLSAAVYTEITDVEVELNGLLTYDREIIKGAVEKIKASNEKVIHDKIFVDEIVSSSFKEAKTWKFTLTEPEAAWYGLKFDDKGWQSGKGGFGTEGTPGAINGTIWNTHDIWLRRDINLGDLSKINIDNLMLSIHHDDACEVYINGVKAADIKGASSGYTMVAIEEAAKKALVSGAKNSIAIHCHQDGGGQYIDAGISVLINK